MSKRSRRQKLPQEPQAATVTALSHDGRGIAVIEGKTTFVRAALPGEDVMFRYTSKRGKFDEGLAEQINTASPDRTTPPCQHFGVCGACAMQHMLPEKQLQHKQTVLQEQLQHFGKVQPSEWLPPLTGPTTGYRHKARLGLRYVHKKEKLLIGFREVGGRLLADCDQCEVLHPSVGHRFDALRQLIQSLSIYEQIPQIEIAVTETQVALVIRHLQDFTEEDLGKLQQFAKAAKDMETPGQARGDSDSQSQGDNSNQADSDSLPFYLYLQPKGPDSIHCIYPAPNTLLQYRLPDFDITYDFHPCDFTQINPDINQRMIAQALAHLDIQADDTVLDLFCGLGNFTLPIARTAKHVVGIEGCDALVDRAKHNARKNQLSNVDFYVADLSQALTGDWATRTYDKLLLDPARTGADGIMPALSTWQPKIIVYVSCNPATLARDAGLLAEQGYTLLKCGVMDMFPHTTHVESMAVFIRG